MRVNGWKPGSWAERFTRIAQLGLVAASFAIIAFITANPVSLPDSARRADLSSPLQSRVSLAAERHVTDAD